MQAQTSFSDLEKQGENSKLALRISTTLCCNLNPPNQLILSMDLIYTYKIYAKKLLTRENMQTFQLLYHIFC